MFILFSFYVHHYSFSWRYYTYMDSPIICPLIILSSCDSCCVFHLLVSFLISHSKIKPNLKPRAPQPRWTRISVANPSPIYAYDQLGSVIQCGPETCLLVFHLNPSLYLKRRLCATWTWVLSFRELELVLGSWVRPKSTAWATRVLTY